MNACYVADGGGGCICGKNCMMGDTKNKCVTISNSWQASLDRGPPVTPLPPWGFFTVVIFEASEYGPIEIRLFAFKLLGLNMLKYAN